MSVLALEFKRRDPRVQWRSVTSQKNRTLSDEAKCWMLNYQQPYEKHAPSQGALE